MTTAPPSCSAMLWELYQRHEEATGKPPQAIYTDIAFRFDFLREIDLEWVAALPLTAGEPDFQFRDVNVWCALPTATRTVLSVATPSSSPDR